MKLINGLKRSNEEASRYVFKITPKMLILDSSKEVFKLEKVVISFMRNSKRYKCKPRTVEKSCSIESRGLITWPDIAPDYIEFISTLYKKESKYAKKEWTIIIEDVSKNKGHKGIAAISFDMVKFISPTDLSAEITLKLRPLVHSIQSCTLIFKILSMHLVTSNESDGASTHDFLSAPLTPSTAINNIEEMIDIETHEIVKVKTVPEEDNSFKPNDDTHFCGIEKNLSDDKLSKKTEAIDNRGEVPHKKPSTRMIKPTLNELTSHPEETNDRLLLFFELSSAEKRIVDDVENMRKTREASGYTDLQDQPSSSNTFDHYMTSSIDRTKILTTVNPQVSIRNFNKHTPSPVLGRQANSESPTLPFSNITERSFTKPNGFSPSNKMYSSMRIPREVNGTPTQNTSILNALGKNVTDFARSGSARGQDLMNFFKQSSLPRPPKTAQEEFRNTPTRKLSTKFEKHFMKQEEIPTELNEIEKRTIEIDQLIEYTEGIIRSSETSDENKMKLINKKQILVQEKDRLTGRQDLLNKYLDYNETKEKVDDLRTKIDELTQSKTSGFFTSEEMREQDALAKQLIEGQRMLTELFLAIEEDSNIDD